MSYELTAYPLLFLPLFDSFKQPCYQKYINQIILNHTTLKNLALPIFKTFALILSDMNLSGERNIIEQIKAPIFLEAVLALEIM